MPQDSKTYIYENNLCFYLHTFVFCDHVYALISFTNSPNLALWTGVINFFIGAYRGPFVLVSVYDYLA
jgi:hypothetical protein